MIRYLVTGVLLLLGLHVLAQVIGHGRCPPGSSGPAGVSSVHDARPVAATVATSTANAMRLFIGSSRM